MTGGLDHQLESTILSLLDRRAAGATICPSEAARAVGGPWWRDLLDPARAAAARLVAAGEVEITQHGHVVDLAAAKGPVRIRRRGPEQVTGWSHAEVRDHGGAGER